LVKMSMYTVYSIPLHIGSYPRKCKTNMDSEVWTGTLAQHEQTCSYALICCPKGCDEMIQRYKLSSHINEECLKRPYCCDFCGKLGTYEEIMNRHKNECPRRYVACINYSRGCREFVQRRRAEGHRATCPFQVIQCKFEKNIGCQFQTLRKNSEIMQNHEADSNYHLTLALDTISKLQQSPSDH
jgi:TNF receptor-associated factor 4